jgi:hypothetical protein
MYSDFPRNFPRKNSTGKSSEQNPRKTVEIALGKSEKSRGKQRKSSSQYKIFTVDLDAFNTEEKINQ